MIDRMTLFLLDLHNAGIQMISHDLGTSRGRLGGRTYLCVRKLQQEGAPVKTSEVSLYYLEYMYFSLFNLVECYYG